MMKRSVVRGIANVLPLTVGLSWRPETEFQWRVDHESWPDLGTPGNMQQTMMVRQTGDQIESACPLYPPPLLAADNIRCHDGLLEVTTPPHPQTGSTHRLFDRSTGSTPSRRSPTVHDRLNSSASTRAFAAQLALNVA